MASPYQQQALRRKLIYIGLIVGLFTVSGIFRAYVVEARAEELSLREQNLGEVELSSSALQLSLTGSRGFVVSALWYWAQDAQKKNRWNELDLYCESLTRLQPHFIMPWFFQSWNLSYNVAVEADQVKDKYFYVSRGVQLLSRGERMNHYNPDMRFNLGFYQQHKIMQSDETNVFRCLYQMSCMPFPERDPERFGPKDPSGRRVIDMAVFEKFCSDHPQFVRRLHDRLRCGKPADVVAFLEDNKQIPSLFVDMVDDPDVARREWAQGHTPLKKIEDRFPALPPPAEVRDRELPVAPPGQPKFDLYDRNELSYDSQLKDDFDAYAASRAWYGYAQDSLPAPDPVVPGWSAEIVDRTRQRKSRMTVSLFRNHPPRAQSYIAERLQDEGWFGPEGWLITGWFPRDRFSDSGKEARVGIEVNWGEDSWKKAYEMWRRRAYDSHIILDAQREIEMREKARVYLKSRGLEPGARPPEPGPARDSPEYEGWEAARLVYELDYTRRLTNVLNFFYRAAAEMEAESSGQSLIEARRTMFNARQSVRQGRRDKAAELFELKSGLERLRYVLEHSKDFREDVNNQEAFYELELRYIKLMQEKDGGTFKQLTAAGRLLGAGLPPGPPPAWPGLLDLALTDPSLTSSLPVPEFVPPERMRVEGPDKDGKFFVNDFILTSVKVRHGLMKQPPPAPGQPMPRGKPPAGVEMPK